MRRLMIRQGNKTCKADDRKFILYGAGAGLMELVERVEIRNIRFVIDKKAEYAKESDCLVQIYNEQYKVFPPQYLKGENLDECIILITTDKFDGEIRKTIKECLPNKCQVEIISQGDIFMEYDSLSELFRYDPVFIKKALTGGLLFDADEIVKKFENIVDGIGIRDEAACFVSLDKGNEKLCCVFGKNEKYFLAIPYIKNISGIKDAKALHNYYSLKNKKELFYIRQKFGIGMELNLYEDESGFLLQHYADDNIDIKSEHYLESVITLLIALHSKKVQVPRKFDIIDDYQYYRKQLSKSDKLLEAIDGKAGALFACEKQGRGKFCVCHGDVFFTNIVGYKGKLYLIDWSFFANPILCMI